MVLWRVRGEVEERKETEPDRPLQENPNVIFFPLCLSPQYNVSPQSGEAPKSRSLERKQQDPIVLTKWRHSTYVLDLNDKVRHGDGARKRLAARDAGPSGVWSYRYLLIWQRV